MDAAQFETTLAKVELRLRRLRVLYDQYFQGVERVEPQNERNEVERLIAALRREQPRNTALRFRLNQVVQRMTAYSNYWQRTCRQIEDGTFPRHVQRARRRFGDPRRPRDPDLDITIDVEPTLDSDPPADELGEEAAGLASATDSDAQASPLAATSGDPGGLPSVLATGPRTLRVDMPSLDRLFGADSDPAPAAANAEMGGAPPPIAAVRASMPPPPTQPRPPIAAGGPSQAHPSMLPPPPAQPRPPIAAGAPSQARPSIAAPPPSQARPAAAAPTPAQARPSIAPPAPSQARPSIAAPPPSQARPAAAASPPGQARPSIAAPPPSQARPAAAASPPGQARPSIAAPPPSQAHPAIAAPPPSQARPSIAAPPPAAAANARVSLKPPAPASSAGSISSGQKPLPASAARHQATASIRPGPLPRSPAPNGGNDGPGVRSEGPSDAQIEALYQRYLDARRKNNERIDNVRLETVAKTVRDMVPKLAEQHAGKRIDFEVVLKGGKVALKPVPK